MKKRTSKLFPRRSRSEWYDRLFQRIYDWRVYVIAVLAIAVPLLLVVAYINSPLRAADEDEPYSIFILAGQSNAAGDAAYTNLLDDGTCYNCKDHPADMATQFWWANSNGQGTDDAITAALFPWLASGGSGTMGWDYSGGGRNLPANQRLLNNLKGRQSTGPGDAALFGSEFGIARTQYDKGDRKVIVLKVTYGFQSLATANTPLIPFDWNVDSPNPNPTSPKSYQQLKDQFAGLTNYLRSQNKKYTVDGIFWMQGETDTLQNEFTNAYQANLQKLAESARRDFQLHPQGRFVIGKVSLQHCLDNAWPRDWDYCAYPWFKSIVPLEISGAVISSFIDPDIAIRLDKLRAAQQAVADNNSWVEIVETNDLPRRGDNDYAHMTAKGQLELGRRFLNMYELPRRFFGARAADYDQDGIPNAQEDTGRGAACPLIINGQTINTANNGNLGDDDSDCDGYPDYLDRLDGPGSGM